MTLLEIQNLHAGYDNNEILRGVTFEVQAQSLVGVLGANGSGKSTLLKALCGILPSQGQITLCGRDARKLSSREMARLSRYIPQRSGISLDISVLDVVLMGFNPQLGLLEYPSAAMREQGSRALQAVGLGQRIHSNFQSLSEGQKQLCILARAMLLESGVLFLDEPESALDFSGRYKMLELIRQWMSQRPSAALVTLHDPQLALNTCNTLLLLKDGKIIASCCPQQDSLAEMEGKLSLVYGNLSVRRCQGRSEKHQLVLLKEE